MAKPAGMQSRLKDNSNKKFRENEEWMKGKKIGRPKQLWVWDKLDSAGVGHAYPGPTSVGHWQKVAA